MNGHYELVNVVNTLTRHCTWHLSSLNFSRSHTGVIKMLEAVCADTGSEQTSVVVRESGGTSVKCSGCSWSLCRAPGCAYLLLRSTKREEPKTAWKATNPSPSLLLPTTPLLPSLHSHIYPSTRHPPLPWLPQARASVRRGWGERAGRLVGRTASCRDQLWPGALMSAGLFVEGQESSESCGGGRQSW